MKQIVVEDVEFNGVTFRRYPEAKQKENREYYRPIPFKQRRAEGVDFLHREVWKAHNGPIPPRYHVHHIDGDSTNNDPSNLEALPPSAHAYEHSQRPRTPAQLNVRSLMRAASRAWHGTPEGYAWHSEMQKKAWQNATTHTFVCIECSKPFETIARFPVKYCSTLCRSRVQHRARTEKDLVERDCPVCGTHFRSNRYWGARYCSSRCSMSVRPRDAAGRIVNGDQEEGRQGGPAD